MRRRTTSPRCRKRTPAPPRRASSTAVARDALGETYFASCLVSEEQRWPVIVSPRAERDLRSIPRSEVVRLSTAIDRLRDGPFRGDVRKLAGHTNEWRLRVGDSRIRFEPDAA